MVLLAQVPDPVSDKAYRTSSEEGSFRPRASNDPTFVITSCSVLQLFVIDAHARDHATSMRSEFSTEHLSTVAIERAAPASVRFTNRGPRGSDLELL